MLASVALVGRTNVGKSTLFNALTDSRDAIVADQPELTRDRHYGKVERDERAFIVIDTGGIILTARGFSARRQALSNRSLRGVNEDCEGHRQQRRKFMCEEYTSEQDAIASLIVQQAEQAIQEADTVLFIVDARAGLMPEDAAIAKMLRPYANKVQVVANKVDGLTHPEASIAEFHSLGFGQPWMVAAAHRRGIEQLIDELLQRLPIIESPSDSDAIRIALVGRPNVGKSTLLNRILGEERVIVYDAPGTTRDSIYVPFERMQQRYILIDTAGVRRRARISEKIEKFSVIKTLQAIEDAHVVVFLCDAQEGITEQDASLLGWIMETGRALVLAVNKCDGLDRDQKHHVRSSLERRLQFVEFARVHYISALHGTGVGDLFASIQEAYRSATCEVSTSKLTRLLQQAEKTHQPPLVRGRRIKLRYAHMGGHLPLRIVIHGNQTSRLPLAYQRYLANFFRTSLKLKGTPLKLELREGENPYDPR